MSIKSDHLTHSRKVREGLTAQLSQGVVTAWKLNKKIWLVSNSCLLIGASLNEPHTSGTALQDVCVCTCMSASDHIPKISIERTDTEGHVHFKFAHMLVNGYWQSGVSVTWSWKDGSSSTHGNLPCFIQQQVVDRQYKVQSRRWSRSFQVRAMHKRHL